MQRPGSQRGGCSRRGCGRPLFGGLLSAGRESSWTSDTGDPRQFDFIPSVLTAVRLRSQGDRLCLWLMLLVGSWLGEAPPKQRAHCWAGFPLRLP